MVDFAPSSRLAVLLFTDLVGSTNLKTQLGTSVFARLLARHDAIFKQLIDSTSSAQIVKDTGDGYFAVFATVSDAVGFALQFQYAMHVEPWGAVPLRTRVGIHIGEVAQLGAEASGQPKIIGMAADLAARLTALAGGGQILMTRFVFDEARQFIHEYPSTDAKAFRLKWVAHGDYLFKGVEEAVEVFEVGGEGIGPLSPPPDSADTRRVVPHDQEQTLGWRPAVGLQVPQRVGWNLQEKVGEGAFGEVWLAHHERTKQHRVFKFCFDADRLRSFKRELTLFRLLRDALGDRSDIAKLYDVKLDEPPFFLESEYTEGGNLKVWSESLGGLNKVPIDQRLSIVARIADAVAAAHSVGILHKDIKPGNILINVEPDGTPSPRLADFGIGILTDRKQLEAHHITTTGIDGLTENESSRSGTRMYAPPEMLAGKAFTMQGDIYSLGVLLYQMVIADLARPLATGWEREVENEFLREDISKCVDGDASRRFSSATELSRRLRALPEREAQRDIERRAAAAQVRRKHLFRAASLLAAACLLIAVVSVAGYFRERSLRAAIAGKEIIALDREHTAKLQLLDNLIIAGDSLAQAKRFAEANNSYDEAWMLAESLSEPTLRAVTGLMQCRSQSPPPLIYRRPTTRPGEKWSSIVRARVSPSGDFLFAGDGNRHGYVFDLPSARMSATVPTGGLGYGVAFTRDGKLCLAGSSAGELQSWDVGHWDKPREVVEKSSFIYALASSPDGRSVVSVDGAGGKIYFWSLDPLRVARVLTVPNKTDPNKTVPYKLYSATFSPDGKLVAAGASAGDIVLWDVTSASVVKTLKGHRKEVIGVAFTPDGKRLLSGSNDKTVRLWEVDSGKELFRFEHSGAVRDVAISHSGRIGASASSDETIKCWDLETGREQMTLSRHLNGATSVDFLPDDSGVVSGGDYGRIAIWNLTADETPVFKIHGARASGISMCPDGLTALSAGWDNKVKRFDLATGHVLQSVTTPADAWCIAAAPDGQTAMVGGGAGMLQVLNLSDFTIHPVDKSQLGKLEPSQSATTPSTQPSDMMARYQKAVTTVAISPKGSAAFVGSNRDSIYSLLPLPLGAGGRSWRGEGRIFSGYFSPDGSKLLIAEESNLSLLDARSGQSLNRMRTTSKAITACAISPDGNTAASGSLDDTIRLWNLKSGMTTQSLTGHLGWVLAVAFFPDGKTLASCGEDETVRLWDVASGNQLRSFHGHTEAVCALAVSQDGQTILSASVDGTIRKWDLSKPKKFREFAIQLTNINIALDANADDAKALKLLGEWYAFRAKDDWAVECLERARSLGTSVSPLMLARCNWKLNRLPEAAREFRNALATKEAPAEYLGLCINAVTKPPSGSRPATSP